MAENMSLADQAVQALAAVKAIGAELTNEHPERHQVRLLQRLAEAQISAGLRQAIDLATGMNDMTRSASSEASALIEDFLAANPLPSSEQWKAFTLAHPAHASQIADTALMLTLDDADFDAEELDVELFNATRSAMLNEVRVSVNVDKEFGFTLDPCSDGTNAKCAKFYSIHDSGITRIIKAPPA